MRDLDAVVIGVPGTIDPATEQLRYAKHLTGWHQPGILTMLAEAIGTDIRVENDVNLAATAEHRMGRPSAAATSSSSGPTRASVAP